MAYIAGYRITVVEKSEPTIQLRSENLGTEEEARRHCDRLLKKLGDGFIGNVFPIETPDEDDIAEANRPNYAHLFSRTSE